MAADGHNLGYVHELHERYLSDAESVPGEWQAYFGSNGEELAAARAESVRLASDASRSIASALALVEAHCRHGHLAARLDPLGSESVADPALDPAQLNPPLPESELARIPADALGVGARGETFADVLARLRDAYCRTIAYEIEYIPSHEQR
jgi:2-oxoglutarate decarboxylase